MNGLSAREQRLAALFILLALVALSWWAVILPITRGFGERGEEKRDLADAYARNLVTMARSPAYRREWRSLQKDAPLFALPASGEDQASDLLREKIAATVRRNGGVTRIVQETQGSPGWVRARADATVNLRQLTQILVDIQSQRPVLVVDNLTVSAEQAFHTGHLAPMDVAFAVSAPFKTSGGR